MSTSMVFVCLMPSESLLVFLGIDGVVDWHLGLTFDAIDT